MRLPADEITVVQIILQEVTLVNKCGSFQITLTLSSQEYAVIEFLAAIENQDISLFFMTQCHNNYLFQTLHQLLLSYQRASHLMNTFEVSGQQTISYK